ncbi:MAG: hypothetical protein F6K04_19705 [Leptolyngbya sp. SIO4C5]|nr:hypothetical protein [Leptolyngbya sp. SIO4C5]
MTDRLDRIEAILERNAEQLAVNTSAIEALGNRITQIGDRIEAGFDRIQQVTDSNARSIQAWDSRIREIDDETGEVTSLQNVDIQQLGRMFWGLVEERRADRQREQARWDENSERFNNLLEDARADRQRMDADRQASQNRYEEIISRMDERAAANEAEHNAFRQNIQVLLAEIARLWQRIAS